MQAVLQALLNLQEIDKEIFRTRGELERLPVERAVRQVEVDKRVARHAELRQQARELRARIKEIENATTTQRQRVRKVEAEAAGSRADMALLVAYQHEIRTLKRDISNAEEEGLMLVEKAEGLEREADALAAGIEGERKVLSEYSHNVDREIAAAEGRLAVLGSERSRRLKGDIPPEALALYSRLLSARGIVPARRATHHAGDPARRGSLMRHFLRRPSARPVAMLAGGVPAPPARGALIVRAGDPHRRPSRDRRAAAAAVSLAPITVGAQEEDLRALAAPAHHKPQRLHASLAPVPGGVDARATSCDERRGL